jgi:hypothetical protein
VTDGDPEAEQGSRPARFFGTAARLICILLPVSA